jgi:hypothetical protein
LDVFARQLLKADKGDSINDEYQLRVIEQNGGGVILRNKRSKPEQTGSKT